MASREKRPGVRGGLLTAFGILSLAACFSSMSLIGMALLPATFVIFFAAARSLAVSVRPLVATLLALLAGLFVATAVGLSFFALFFGIEDPEARCWVLTMGTDGQPVWESRPNAGGAGSLGVELLGGSERGVCVSDIISSSEAAVGMGFLAIAFMGTLLISTRGRLLYCSRRAILHSRRGGRPRGDGGVGPGTEAEGGDAGASELARIRRLLGTGGRTMSSMAWLSTGGGIPIEQTRMAPDGLEWLEDVSHAHWIEESLSDFGTLRSMLPGGFSNYARIFHPAYLGEEMQPVRWSTVASWTGKVAHPLMQFERIAGLSEDPGVMYPDPPWGSHPRVGSIPEAECRSLVEVLREFTSTPGTCYFCLWEGYGNIDTRLYKSQSRVRAPGRDYLLFSGPLDAVMSFLQRDWGDSPNIWWPEDRAWCVATDIDLCDTYVGGSLGCIEAVLSSPDLEALPTSLDARLDLGGDIINAPEGPEGGSE